MNTDPPYSTKSAQRKLPSQMKNYLNAIAGQASICSLNFRVRNENIYSAAATALPAPFPAITPVYRARKVIPPPWPSRNQIANRQQAAGGRRRAAGGSRSAPGGSQLADSGSSAISAASGTAGKGVPTDCCRWGGGGAG